MPELLSPAGNFEKMKAAIQYGADAVYLAGQMFGMRSAADNFTVEELYEAARYVHARGKKIYLTVNTMPRVQEYPLLRKFLQDVKGAGIDAMIVADLGVMSTVREILPEMEIHISTQTSIVSPASARAWAAMGAERLVLARELSLEQVKHISDQIVERDLRGPKGEPLRIEMFAHGALCMSISGKCYLSEHEENCSANRGACRQICRRKYTITDKDTGHALDVDGQYILSPKDLCTVDFLDKFINAGVSVLKIEGRARGAEYVKRVVESYDAALKAMERGEYNAQYASELKEKLATVFNRGFWEGYYAGKPMAEHCNNYGSAATERKVYVGKVTHFCK